ncbi:YeiH family protein [Pantoea coffeiphila]|uniref:YeiH family protein n=1 Tax=Pantoea coffeiphila TaxID=1465635 RepID=UPI001960EE60|nr:YeiH family putative sulfate export transporter [Pantoea coffeiphila]MBM7344895.1 putative integral membrane protein (TIGR00698 family) [Pantoea coffeiphila]
MTDIPLVQYSHTAKRFIPGILLTLAIALGTAWLGNQPVMSGLGLGALTLAIIVGIVLGNTVYPLLHPQCDEGVQFAKQKLLRLGIIFYGFRLTFQQVMDVGLSGVVVDVVMLSSTFLIASYMGSRLLGIDRQTAWLIGAGSSICGAAAVLATAPVVKAESSKVAVAVATVVIFGTVGIFLYPWIWHHIASLIPGISATQFGVYTGSTMHEVAQVVAAGHAVSPETENAAVIAKMLRVMMLAPFLLVLSIFISRGTAESGTTAQRIVFPWFALMFIVVAMFNSFHLLPLPVVAAINSLDNVMLAMAMAALGLSTRISQLMKAGTRPFALGLFLFIWLIVGGGAINLLVHHALA